MSIFDYSQYHTMEQLFEHYPIPTYIVSSILLLWALSKFFFPHLPSLSDVFFKTKDSQINDLKQRLLTLENECNKIKIQLNISEQRENQLLGLIRGLSFQLRMHGVDIDEEIDKIINRHE